MSNTDPQNPGFLTPKQLSARWAAAVTVTTLANWRSRKVGPTYVKMGASVLYPLDAVLAYEAANRKEHA